MNYILNLLMVIISCFFIYVGFKGVKDFFIYPEEKYLKKELPFAMLYGCFGFVGLVMVKMTIL